MPCVYVCNYNRAEKLYEEYNQFRAVIKHSGRVHWEPAGRSFGFVVFLSAEYFKRL